MRDDAENQDPSREDLPGPGERLKRAREEQGLVLAQVAAELHLDEGKIEALEGGRYEVLGAPVFVRGHLRNYAALLKLDTEDLLQHMDALGTDPSPAAVSTDVELTMQRERRIRKISFLIGFLLSAAAFIYAGLWVARKVGDRSAGDAAITPQLIVPRPASDEIAGDDKRDAHGGDTLPVRLQAATGQATVTDELPVATAQTPPKPSTIDAILNFNGDSWVEAYDAGGRRLIYEMGRSGSRKKVSGVPPLEIFLGYSDGVEILVDGKPLPMQNARRRGNTAQITIERDQ